MTIGISGDSTVGAPAPFATADNAAPGTVPETALAVLGADGLFDRVREDPAGITGRLTTSDQDPLQIIVQLLRAILTQNIEAFSLNGDVDDYVTSAAIDHPIN